MPRSPSRDLSDRYIGRRGYFRNPDAIRKGKYALSFIALFAAFGWAAVDVLQPSRAAYGHSHGPLANPHAAFDDNCNACHASYSLSDFGPFSMFNARERWHNLTCDKCHSGPPHHDSATPEGAARHKICSNCHHDHQGRLFSLVRLNDRDCNACHENLAKWHDPDKSLSKHDGGPYANKVTNFVTDHPKFRSLAGEDGEEKGPPKHKPRTLIFSHGVHMSPGQAYDPTGKEAMTVQKLRALGGKVAVDRYAPGAADGDKVQLACASCHTLDTEIGSSRFQKETATLDKGDPIRALLPPRTEGAYFLPVNYEAHCRSCHPTTAIEGSVVKGTDRLIVPRFDLPHRKQTSEIRALLRAGYVKELIALGELPRAKPGDVVKPPQQPGLPPEAVKPDPELLAFESKVKELTEKAERLLFNGEEGCAKCHKTEPNKSGDGVGFDIKPVPDRTVWLAHAKFNHASHRGATCASCHPNTKGQPTSQEDAKKPEPVQILGLESCRTCHSPTSTRVKVPDPKTGTEVETFGGGVRANCTDCHRYHHGDQPLQGRGAQSWYPEKPRDLVDWLKGK
jgi:hypothetical protein